jgi:hypothetical protein
MADWRRRASSLVRMSMLARVSPDPPPGVATSMPPSQNSSMNAWGMSRMSGSTPSTSAVVRT